MFTENNTASCFVNGELIVKSLQIVDGSLQECEFGYVGEQYYYYITLGNKTGYTIESITIDDYSVYTTFDVIDAEHIKIPRIFTSGWAVPSITSITYSNASLGQRTKVISGV
jgi:hypothetical protein